MIASSVHNAGSIRNGLWPRKIGERPKNAPKNKENIKTAKLLANRMVLGRPTAVTPLETALMLNPKHTNRTWTKCGVFFILMEVRHSARTNMKLVA